MLYPYVYKKKEKKVEEHSRSFIFAKIGKKEKKKTKEKKRKDQKMLEDGRLPWVHEREGAGPEELMK